MFTRAHHTSLFLTRLILSMPSHTISWKSILILTFPPCMVLPNDLFPSSFSTKILCVYLPPCACHMPHLWPPQFDQPVIFHEEYKSEAPHYAIFSVSYYFLPFRPQYSSDPILIHPHVMFFPSYEEQTVTPTQHKKRNCCSAYITLHTVT